MTNNRDLVQLCSAKAALSGSAVSEAGAPSPPEPEPPFAAPESGPLVPQLEHVHAVLVLPQAE